jgi:hypothetical protein
MSPKRRLLAAAFLAALALGAITGVVALFRKSQREPVARPSEKVASPAVALKAETPPALAVQAPVNVATAPLVEQPIEEVLLESGEDPGAVFYMSRVREALREGNPTFAKELFRQMKEKHSNSILVEEAERLFESERKKP